MAKHNDNIPEPWPQHQQHHKDRSGWKTATAAYHAMYVIIYSALNE